MTSTNYHLHVLLKQSLSSLDIHKLSFTLSAQTITFKSAILQAISSTLSSNSFLPAMICSFSSAARSNSSVVLSLKYCEWYIHNQLLSTFKICILYTDIYVLCKYPLVHSALSFQVASVHFLAPAELSHRAGEHTVTAYFTLALLLRTHMQWLLKQSTCDGWQRWRKRDTIAFRCRSILVAIGVQPA